VRAPGRYRISLHYGGGVATEIADIVNASLVDPVKPRSRQWRIHRGDRDDRITERRVPELIPVLGSQPADDVGHKPGGRLPLLSARPAVTLTTLKRAATNFAAW